MMLSTSCCILAIDLRRDHVEACDQRNQVRDHQPAAEYVDHAHRSERTGANLDPPWIAGAVADAVPAHVAASALQAYLGLAGGRLEIARHFREHRARRNLLERLAQDLYRLF